MNYYDSNFQCIKEVRPLLFEAMESYKEKSRLAESVVSEPSRDGNLSLKVTNEKMEYRLNSAYRPLEEATRWAQQFEFVNLNIIVEMFGMGNGYFLRELIKKLRNGDHIIVAEPSYEVFLHVMHEYDITDILKDTRVSIAITEINQVMFPRMLGMYVHWMNAQSQISCSHPQYDKCFEKESKEFYQLLSENNNKTFINRNTEVHFAQDLVQNTLKNMKYIPGSNYLLEYRDVLPKDIPAIIVAAGPSLDQNIELLKEAKGKAVIVACDTSLRFLHKRGIEADIVVTLDPKKPPSYFENTGFENIPLFGVVQANADALCQHTGKKVWFNCHDFMNRMYKKYGYVMSNYSCGGSVACGAFMVCSALQFEKIVFVGQDLAYKGNITHADGNVSEIQAEETGIRYVEGIDGNPIKTRHDWYIYLKWFEDAIVEAHHFAQVIDATEGGAKIHGADIMTLREVIDNYCKKEVNVRQIIESVPPTFNDAQLKDFDTYLKNGLEDLDWIEKEAKNVISLCEKVLEELYTANRPGKVSAYGQEIAAKNDAIARKPVFALINDIVKQDAMESLQDMCMFETDERKNKISTFKSTQRIFEIVRDACKDIAPMLRTTIEEFEENMQ